MAEIHVQTKKNTGSPMWIWIVVVVLIAAAVLFILMRNNKTDKDNTVPNTTSYQQPGATVESGHAVDYTSVA
jgi:bacteriorhodopsin